MKGIAPSFRDVKVKTSVFIRVSDIFFTFLTEDGRWTVGVVDLRMLASFSMKIFFRDRLDLREGPSVRSSRPHPRSDTIQERRYGPSFGVDLDDGTTTVLVGR